MDITLLEERIDALADQIVREDEVSLLQAYALISVLAKKRELIEKEIIW